MSANREGLEAIDVVGFWDWCSGVFSTDGKKKLLELFGSECAKRRASWNDDVYDLRRRKPIIQSSRWIMSLRS